VGEGAEFSSLSVPTKIIRPILPFRVLPHLLNLSMLQEEGIKEQMFVFTLSRLKEVAALTEQAAANVGTGIWLSHLPQR
jgi:hypothetical protein